MEAVKTIIITGGGGHLGQCVARWWAKPGTHLVLIDRDAERLAAARTNLAARGAELTLLATDLAVPDDLQAAAASLPASLWQSPPSLVLAHALSGKGPGAKSARLGDLDHDHWQDVLDVNLTSAVFAIQAFLPFMKQAGGGRIVLVSSTAGVVGVANGRPLLLREQGRYRGAPPPAGAGARFVQGADQCRGAGQVLQSRLARRP